MTVFDPKEKFKNLAKIGPNVLQCIACGDCRELTDYTSDPPRWGVCVAKDHTSGFEPFFGRGKMQIIRSLWQGKLELSKEMAEVITNALHAMRAQKHVLMIWIMLLCTKP